MPLSRTLLPSVLTAVLSPAAAKHASPVRPRLVRRGRSKLDACYVGSEMWLTPRLLTCRVSLNATRPTPRYWRRLSGATQA